MTRTVFLILAFLLIQFSLYASETAPKIGLVLSGGGARGIAHIGALKVLQENDIEFDMITGTSMGAIVGGLLAVGYRAEEMEKLVLSQNWDAILFDQIERSSISLEEKEDTEKYVGSFPILGTKIALPMGLVAGQQIQVLLTELFIPFHEVEDFDLLPIPFRCLATDIEKGEAVVFKSGFLPDAIRASMSIPSAFKPIEIEGQMLIDGGILQNFPVEECRNMGAEIIIGIDVSTLLYSKRKLDSLVKIMNQAVTLQGVDSVIRARKDCDILIEPMVDEYSILDFSSAEELLKIGEEAALKVIPQLKELSERNPSITKSKNLPSPTMPEFLNINRVLIQGLRKVSYNLISGKLQIKDDSVITLDALNTAIDRVYGSRYFEKVTYKLEPVGSKYDLFIRVIEKNQDELNFSFRYDETDNTSLLLNTTMRNRLIMGSKLAMDIIFGKNIGYRSSYFIHTGWKPGIGAGISLSSRGYDIKLIEEEIKIALYNYRYFFNRLDFQTIVSNSSTLGAAAEYWASSLKPEIIPPDWLKHKIEYEHIANSVYFLFDSLDRKYYPSRGIQFKAEWKRIYHITNNLHLDFDPIDNYLFHFWIVNSLSEELIWEERISIGKIDGEQFGPESYFYLGGLTTPLPISIPVVGQEFMSIIAKTHTVVSSRLRYRIWKNFHLAFLVDWAVTGSNLGDFFNEPSYYKGFGLGFFIKTPVGPVELYLAGDKDLLFNTKIGYDL
jgi:NTE family protein